MASRTPSHEHSYTEVKRKSGRSRYQCLGTTGCLKWAPWEPAPEKHQQWDNSTPVLERVLNGLKNLPPTTPGIQPIEAEARAAVEIRAFEGQAKTYTITSANIDACPQRRLDASHYREDGSCFCPPEKPRCPRCERAIRLTTKGAIGKHDKGAYHRTPCLASGKDYEAEVALFHKHGKRQPA